MKPANLMLFGMMLASLSQAQAKAAEAELSAASRTLIEAAEDIHADIEQPVVLIDGDDDE